MIDNETPASSMTMRELLAAMMMQGMFANSAMTGKSAGTPAERAEAAVICANSLIAELNKNGGGAK